MWLLDHPAKVFKDFFVKPQDQVFVLNALISKTKWDEYPKELIDDLEALSVHGLSINHIELPDSGGSDVPMLAVHIAWTTSVV
jgi:hypothetical protein